MSRVLRDVGDLFDRRLRRKGSAVLTACVLSSLLEVASIAAVIPLVSIVLDSSGEFFDFFGYQINIWLALSLFVTLYFASTAFRIFTVFFQNRYSADLVIHLSKRYFQNTFYEIENGREFGGVVSENISEVVTKIPSSVRHVINPAFVLVNGVIFAIFISAFMFYSSVLLAVSALSIIVLTYLLFNIFTRSGISRLSKKMDLGNSLVTLLAKEGQVGRISILLNGDKERYLRDFESQVTNVQSSQSRIASLSAMTRPIIEAVGLVVLLVFLAISKAVDSDMGLELIVAFALAFQKLAPVGQQIYSSYVLIKGYMPNLKVALRRCNGVELQNELRMRDENISNFDSLALKDVSVSVGGNEILTRVNLEINKGDIVGIIGSSGSGKSKLLEVVCGVRKPTNGAVELNGRVVADENLKGLRSISSYVPQEPFVMSGTVSENILSGEALSPSSDSVKKSLIQSCFVESERDYADKINQQIDEAGVNLSGGQRQRLAIARALYKNKPALLLDEATSAQDPVTEKVLMENLAKLTDKTIVMVTHNHELLSYCNRVISVECGTVLEVNK